MNCSLSARLFLCVAAQLDAAALGYKVPSCARLTDVTTGAVWCSSSPALGAAARSALAAFNLCAFLRQRPYTLLLQKMEQKREEEGSVERTVGVSASPH